MPKNPFGSKVYGHYRRLIRYGLSQIVSHALFHIIQTVQSVCSLSGQRRPVVYVSMESRKSFEGIHEDYAFVLAHSGEPRACREALLAEAAKVASSVEKPRWLDFGCGGGEFLSGLLDGWPGDLATVDLALVDVDPGYLEAACNLAKGRCRSVHGASRLDGLPAGGFDLITSNHVLYYVPDMAATLGGLYERLRSGGRAVLVLGGKDNQLIRLWLDAFNAANIPLPYFHAGHVEETLNALEISYGRTALQYLFCFPDTRENRQKVLRFLFKEWVETLGEENLLSLMDAYAHNGDIVMENSDALFMFSSPT